MLTPLARQKVEESHLSVAPPSSDTAKFEVGAVERIGDDGARVHVNWTDMDEANQPQRCEMLWMVRREAEGWRVAGVAVPVLPNEPRLVLNFEDPDDMIQKRQMLHEELARREAAVQAGTQQSTAQTGAISPVQRGRPAESAAGNLAARGNPSRETDEICPHTTGKFGAAGAKVRSLFATVVPGILCLMGNFHDTGCVRGVE